MSYPRVNVIATQHLDVAWLWTRAPYGEELMRQCFERAIEIIEDNPGSGFVFSRSTAWSFRVVEQHYPALFEKVKRYVAEGRIELCGGEWVEPDHLIPDGESLIRQCALGQWYYLETFGKCASVCWDPDIFGHPHSIPQIIRKCGMDGFYSHRCRPRDEEGRSLHQFIWEGPDGSRIFYLAGTWINAPDAESIRGALAAQCNQDLPAVHVATGLDSDRRITMNTEWDTIRQEAVRELGADLVWVTAEDVVRDMKTYADQLPLVRGELGFQYSGTYTSNGGDKRFNREIETLLSTAEKAAAWASELGLRYPRAQLRQAWRDHCLNHFHDIICGCSIPDVHEEGRALWMDVKRRAGFVRDEALSFLCDRMYHQRVAADAPTAGIVAVFNLLGWPRNSVIELPLPESGSLSVSLLDGTPLPVQVTDAGLLVQVADTPAIGCQLLRVQQSPRGSDAHRIGDDLILENSLVRVVIDPDTGELTSIIDKQAGTENIAEGGRGNRLMFLEDDHTSMPAWSIKYTGRVLDPGIVERAALIEDGPVRHVVRVVRSVQLGRRPETKITQDIIVEAGSPVVRFECSGEWHAAQVMLKAAFDLAFDGEAASDAPYAVVEDTGCPLDQDLDSDTLVEDRNIRTGDSGEDHDHYMQKWVDISDGRQGVLFLNNGLYGFDRNGRQLRLSLLRSPFAPGTANEWPPGETITGLGPFSLSYGLVPHAKGWREVCAPRLGYEFNHSLHVRSVKDGFEPGGVWRDWWDRRESAPEAMLKQAFQMLQSRSSVLAVMKGAEDGSGIILRIVETYGRPDNIVIVCHSPITSARETDMLERPLSSPSSISSISVTGSEMTVAMEPWEIKTIRLVTGHMHAETTSKSERKAASEASDA